MRGKALGLCDGSVPPVERTASPGPPAPLADLLGVLDAGVHAVQEALRQSADLRRPGRRSGQYHLDLVADDAICEVLHRGGLDVMSEESGYTEAPATSRSSLLAVVDPVDGSTNASIGIPWFATSVCVLDDEGPLLALVVNLASGTRYDAARGGGARRDGLRIVPSACKDVRTAVVGVSGLPAGRPAWAQFRALGAAALDMCAVAEGVLDGYRVVGSSALSGWDYLGGLLVCKEAGAHVSELDGRELVVRDATPRRPVAASTRPLLDQLAAAAL